MSGKNGGLLKLITLKNAMKKIDAKKYGDNLVILKPRKEGWGRIAFDKEVKRAILVFDTMENAKSFWVGINGYCDAWWSIRLQENSGKFSDNYLTVIV